MAAVLKSITDWNDPIKHLFLHGFQYTKNTSAPSIINKFRYELSGYWRLKKNIREAE